MHLDLRPWSPIGLARRLVSNRLAFGWACVVFLALVGAKPADPDVELFGDPAFWLEAEDEFGNYGGFYQKREKVIVIAVSYTHLTLPTN